MFNWRWTVYAGGDAVRMEPDAWQPRAWDRDPALMHEILSWNSADFARVIFYRWLYEVGRLTDELPACVEQEAKFGGQPLEVHSHGV